jgi:hypothetical protein
MVPPPMPTARLACPDDRSLRSPGVAMAYRRSRSPVLHGRLRLSGPPVRPWSDRGYNRPPDSILGTLVLLRCPRTADVEPPWAIVPLFSALAGEPLSAQDFRGFPRHSTGEGWILRWSFRPDTVTSPGTAVNFCVEGCGTRTCASTRSQRSWRHRPDTGASVLFLQSVV